MGKSLRSKEYDRITQQIRRAERRGYRFDEDFKQSLKNMTYEELKQIHVDNVYNSGWAADPDTGEVIPGDKAREMEKEWRREEARERAQKKYSTKNNDDDGGQMQDALPDMADAMLAGWDAMWEGLKQGRAVGGRFIIERTGDLVEKYGSEAVARAIYEAEQEGLVNVAVQGYDENEAMQLMYGIQNLLWEMTGASEDEIREEQEEIANMYDFDGDDVRFYDGEYDL